MTHKDIDNYKDLERFILNEVRTQVTIKKKTVEIKLDRKWFFKAMKLIMFTLAHDKEEHDARLPIKEEWTWFKVTVNGYKTTFRIYDL